MSQSGISLGPDMTLTVRDSDGVYLQNDKIQEFMYRWNTEQRDVNTLGKVYPLSFIRDVTGDFSIVRKDSDLEEYFVKKYERYSAGINIPPIFIQGVLTEPNGSVTTYNFNNVVMDLEDGGRYTRDSEIVMRVNFRAINLKIVRG
jgi:hypothetical protein